MSHLLAGIIIACCIAVIVAAFRAILAPTLGKDGSCKSSR